MVAVALAIFAVLLASIAAVGLAGWLLVRAARARIEEQDRIAARVEETFSGPRLAREERKADEQRSCDP